MKTLEEIKKEFIKSKGLTVLITRKDLDKYYEEFAMFYAAHVWEEACKAQKFDCAIAAKKYQHLLTKEDALKQRVCILNCETVPYPNK